jgi:hypothetical protein
MLGELTKIGEKLILVNLKSDEGEYKPGYPEGTICEIVDYSLVDMGIDEYQQSKGLKPGMYENRAWPLVRMPDDKIMSIGMWNFTAYDCHEYGERLIEFRKYQDADKDHFWHSQIPNYRAELPKTEFKIGDHVRIIDRDGVPREFMGTRTYKVIRINYLYLWQHLHEGKELRQIYHIETYPETPSSVFISIDDRLELVQND